jgi:hypothetical protein
VRRGFAGNRPVSLPEFFERDGGRVPGFQISRRSEKSITWTLAGVVAVGDGVHDRLRCHLLRDLVAHRRLRAG